MIYAAAVVLSIFLLSILIHRIKHTSVSPEDTRKKGLSTTAWMRDGILLLGRNHKWRSLGEHFQKQAHTRFSLLGRLFFYGMTASYAAMVLTGFLGSGIGLFRLQGLFLILHVSLGGIFALSAAAVFILQGGTAVHFDLKNKNPKNMALALSNFAFWLFVLTAFLLTVTSLSMMLAFVPFQIIRTAFLLHKVFALMSLCSAIFWLGMQPDPAAE